MLQQGGDNTPRSLSGRGECRNLICFNTLRHSHPLLRKQSDSRQPWLAEQEWWGAEILFFTTHKFRVQYGGLPLWFNNIFYFLPVILRAVSRAVKKASRMVTTFVSGTLVIWNSHTKAYIDTFHQCYFNFSNELNITVYFWEKPDHNLSWKATNIHSFN